MSRLGLRAILGAGMAVAVVFGMASPAQAHPTGLDITSPVGAQDQSPGTVDARITPGHSTLTSARVRVVQVGSEPPRPDLVVTGAPSSSMRFPVSLPFNGAYRATVTVTFEDRGPLGVVIDEGSTEDVEDFTVNAPPVNPTGVKTVVDAASRAVTVSWAANTEPDMLFYVVQRAKGGSTDFAQVGGAISHPTTQFVDTTTAEAGGEYRYQVVAVRQSAVKDEGISSDPSVLSADSTATVPDPPVPPTTAAGAGPGTTVAAGAAGTASTLPANSPGALTTSGKVDLNGFTNVQSQSQRRTPRTIPPPDTGFQGTLPFAAQPDQEEGEVEEGGELAELAADSPQFRELGEGDEAADRQRTMAFFAAGLLATVLLMHVLWVKSEVKRVPLEALAPEGPLPLANRPGSQRGEITAARGRHAKPRRPVDRPKWFVPDRLGPDGPAGRTVRAPARPQKVSSGS